MGALGRFGASPGRRGASVPLPGRAGGRRGPSPAVGRLPGFCSCMSSPGDTGFRMPPGPPGRLGPPPCLPWGALGSRRIGLPTSSSDEGGRPPGPPGPRRCCGAPLRPGMPGRWGAPGRIGAPLRGGPLRWGAGRCCWLGGLIGTGGLFWSRRGTGAAGLAGLGGGAVGLLITTGGLAAGLAGGRLGGCCGGRLLACGRSGLAGLAGLAAGLATISGLRLGGAEGGAAADWLGVLGAFFNERI